MMRARLLPLFLISGAAVGFETALTRYFAVAKWSEYGYWVISIVMVGFAFSGVTMALARDQAMRHARLLLSWLPVALVLMAAFGFRGGHGQPVQPAAAAELDDLSAADRQYRAVLRRCCCRSSI